MKKVIVILGVIFGVIMSLNSCTKESEGSVVFWYGQETSEELADYNISTLKFYLAGELVGSTSADVYWYSKPDCGSNASITATINLGKYETQAYDYEVKDQYGNILWEGTINVNADECQALELQI
ncbi:MAG: hypothetical protein A2W98_14870 [Bacteroidetes bacterium GWF2_33_38]|nr:MAG: hypothetical protein A2W98_14870 [Bacteroidetes bacterium GWF2_33_38]OFY91332.1 MAG: hypothetical protein A2236_13775 [Bacteroidetes bacterium RIFOXYA2_FULL_33_7]